MSQHFGVMVYFPASEESVCLHAAVQDTLDSCVHQQGGEVPVSLKSLDEYRICFIICVCLFEKCCYLIWRSKHS